MSTPKTFPFNNLPLELQREIFVSAAEQVPRSAFRLVCVAKWVNIWIRPYIYRTVVLGSNDTSLFLRTMNSMPAEFFAAHVKRLCLSASVKSSSAAHILSICTGIVDLAFWVDYIGVHVPPAPVRFLPSLVSPLPLRRLSIEFSHFNVLFCSLETSPVWCETLTHLDIVFWKTEDSPSVAHLDKLSSLSHLTLRLRDTHVKEDSLLAILSTCRLLKFLIVFEDLDAEEMVSQRDQRLVYLPYPPNVIYAWEAQGDKTDSVCTWARAEELVRRHLAASERERASCDGKSQSPRLSLPL